MCVRVRVRAWARVCAFVCGRGRVYARVSVCLSVVFVCVCVVCSVCSM